jgi:hypothetical protein
MSSPHMYVEHFDDFDRTLVTVFTFAKYNGTVGNKLTVLEHGKLSMEQKLSLNDLYPTNFTSGDLQITYFLKNIDNLHNITGRVFSKPGRGEGLSANGKVAIVGYIYWFEYFAEIANYIKKLSTITHIDFYIYMCDVNSEQYKQKALDLFLDKSYDIDIIFEWVPNRGRDIWSFLKFIIDGKYQQYNRICKIHTKKSTYLAENWRSSLLENLLLCENTKHHWATLKQKKISSHGKYMLWETLNSRNPNYDSLSRVMKLYSKSLNTNQKYKFHAGTMFWCTNELCKIVNSQLSINYLYDFEEEPIREDGTLAHGWERAFHLLH